ncbi:MAG: hypothetical protein AAGF07_03235 [Patescibacteria group bacterium]
MMRSPKILSLVVSCIFLVPSSVNANTEIDKEDNYMKNKASLFYKRKKASVLVIELGKQIKSADFEKIIDLSKYSIEGNFTFELKSTDSKCKGGLYNQHQSNAVYIYKLARAKPRYHKPFKIKVDCNKNKNAEVFLEIISYQKTENPSYTRIFDQLFIFRVYPKDTRVVSQPHYRSRTRVLGKVRRIKRRRYYRWRSW